MTISVWRYAHLTLALFSFLFLTMLSITGAILAIDAVNEKIPSYQVHDLNTITLAETLPVLKKTYPEIIEINVDHNQFVTLQGMNDNGDDVNAYVDPKTAKITGTPQKKSAFIQWVTSLHRSLFLHETGRVLIGITAFLLLLITISGTILIIQRQQGFRRFFSKIAKDYLAQYYHVVAGRLLLIPIFIMALTGTYLSMERFHLFPENKISHKLPEVTDSNPKAKKLSDFSIFRQIKLADVQKIEFPFAEDPEEYYTLKLKDRELMVDQFNGKVVSEIPYQKTFVLASLSMDLHTGRANMVWAIILAIASVNILFFIYSGFAMTLKRRSTKIKNKHKASESKFILLAGSENGSTLRFANAIHEQLLAHNQLSYLAETNKYTDFPNADHIVIFTSTHGLGDAPTNADKLVSLIKKHPQKQKVNVSVVGFGSLHYPDFCGFAKEIHTLLQQQSWVDPALDLHTVNDKSLTDFALWVKAWNEKTQLPLSVTPASYNQTPGNLQKMKVLGLKSSLEENQTFMVTLRPESKIKFTSGDLLAIYPSNDATERLYSIGKINHNIQLVVKLHPNGLGSNYLYNLTPETTIEARIIHNHAFHFPKKAASVVMIANGTGIAPFLGMIEQNKKKKKTYLYCGFREETEMVREYKKFADNQIEQQQLENIQIAFSREKNLCYVMDLIKKDADFFADTLQKGGTIMICGSLAMQQNVEAVLNTICLEKNNTDLKQYRTKGQILTDCY